MDYKKLYNNIILNASLQKRKRGDGNFYEKHHIIPRCVGGGNTSENLVLLTYKEHFICHKLLHRIYPTNNKIFYGYFAMAMMKKDLHNKFFNISAREYDSIKREHIKRFTGKNNPMFGKEGYLKGKFGKEHPVFGKYFDHKGEKNPMYGKTGEKCPHFGKKRGEEFSKKITLKNLQRDIITCPHCNTTSKNIGVMNMWHFDNCKKNPNNTITYIQCPFCSTSSRNMSNMKRFHFDNCKYKLRIA